MNVQEIANELVDLCRQGKGAEAQNKLYATDVRSIEPWGENREVQGIEAVRGKSEWWNKTFEVKNAEIGNPIVAGNHFALPWKVETVNRETGEASTMDEICLYEVNGDGKICCEQFFYPGK